MESSAGRRVLVVDDVAEMRLTIRRALSACGYEVDAAATLAQAHEMNPASYDAVLVDAGLGAEHGIDLLETLRAEDPATVRRCLMITGGAIDAVPAGVARLAKPFRLDELVDAVRALQLPGHVPASGEPADIGPVHAGPAPGSALPDGNPAEAAEPQAWQVLRLIRRLRARERHELVGFLHDGPIQELTAATLELQMSARSAQPSPAPPAVPRRLDAATASLRWLVDGNWPFLAPEIRLAAAIRQRTAWLLAAPATMDADGPPAGLTAMEEPVIVDVVELMLLGVMPAGLSARAHVAVRAEERALSIEVTFTRVMVDGQAIADPAAARAALAELARALGATLHVKPAERDWRAQIILPRQPALAVKQPSAAGQ